MANYLNILQSIRKLCPGQEIQDANRDNEQLLWETIPRSLQTGSTQIIKTT